MCRVRGNLPPDIARTVIVSAVVAIGAAIFGGFKWWHARLEGCPAVRVKIQEEYSLRGEKGQFIPGGNEHRLRTYAHNRGGVAVEVMNGEVEDLDRRGRQPFGPVLSTLAQIQYLLVLR